MNILLIMGGWSSEREVSLSGGREIHKALRKLGHTVAIYDPEESLQGLLAAAAGQDLAFLNLHGSPGEDGVIQAMLERVGCAYQWANPAASLLALNKAAAKELFAAAGLTTAPGLLLNELPDEDFRPALPYPLFIKANTGGSSLNMERVERPEELGAALKRLFAVNTSNLVESAVSGREITCGVLGRIANGREIPEALPPILIRPASGSIFDYASKYSPGGAEELCPAPIPQSLTERLQNMALAAHRILGISGYSRADFIVPENGDPVLLEVNTLPGMTPTSLIPKEAAAAGLSFEELIARLIELGLARKQRDGDRDA